MICEKKVKLHTSGRLCLFGEHCDWAAEYGIHKGFCLVIGTDQGLEAVAKPFDRFAVRTACPTDSLQSTSGPRQMVCQWDADALLAVARDETEFFRYYAGAAYEMHQLSNVKGGIDIQITSMDLPLRKGLSSSATICVLVAKAFEAVYNLGLFTYELMELAYRGERLTGSQCGQMDQACVYGKTSMLLTFQKSVPARIEPIFPENVINLLLVDLAGRKDTVKILSDLHLSYLKSSGLQKALGEENERIVRLAYQALNAGDASVLGELMTETQDIFDELVVPHSPDELKSPLLHTVLEFEDIAKHIYGGKGVGSHGDGTAQFVVRSVADRDAATEKISRHFPRMRCFPLTIVSQVPRTSNS